MSTLKEPSAEPDHNRDSLSVLSEIADINPHISQFSFRSIPRILRPNHKNDNAVTLDKFKTEALELRSNYGISFWMAMGFVLERHRVPLPETMVRATSHHARTESSEIQRVKSSSSNLRGMRELAWSQSAQRMLTVLSSVHMSDESIRHIPMLDFRAAPTQIHEQNIELIMQTLRQSGFLLVSGNSYHFYGAKLLTYYEMTEFLARASLFIPIVDHRWTAHQLIEGQCALRVSGSPFSGEPPTLVKKIGLD